MAAKVETMTDRAASMAHERPIARPRWRMIRWIASPTWPTTPSDRFESAAARKMRQARELQDDMLEAVNDKLGRVDSYVKENPFTAAGIAFALGAIVSALIRR